MKVLNLVVEHIGSEMLINGKNWQDSHADAETLELLLRKMPLEQQWALLTVLRKTVCKVEDCYRQARVMAKELPMTDYERMKRNRSAAGGIESAGIKRLRAGDKSVSLRDVLGVKK